MASADPSRMLAALVAKHGTQKRAAAAIGVSVVYFHDVLKGHRPAGAKILKALGLVKVIQRVQA